MSDRVTSIATKNTNDHLGFQYPQKKYFFGSSQEKLGRFLY